MLTALPVLESRSHGTSWNISWRRAAQNEAAGSGAGVAYQRVADRGRLDACGSHAPGPLWCRMP